MQAENADKVEKESGQEEKPKTKRGTAGAPRGNRNAAKVGDDLRLELFLSKPRRMFLEEWFTLKFGRAAADEDELREAVRKLANNAINQAIVEEFERHQPGRTSNGGEVF
jgi:hypothetical protein